MAELSNAAELLVLDWILTTGSPTRPAASALALDTTTITDADTGATITEPPDANGYDRQVVTWNAASAGSADNSSAETFGPCITTNWGSITDFAVVDSATYGAGGVVVFSALTTPRTINIDDSLQFAAGSVVVTAD
ncbi:MAG: hypothetical protein OEQ29_09540 [Alphaproteobacteria bacterium]|nr:hypothetical protein [Alphaproteobacteria bacterium]